MTVRDTDDLRIANLRAALASVSARIQSIAWRLEDMIPRTAVELLLVHDSCEAALKADERAGGKPT